VLRSNLPSLVFQHRLRRPGRADREYQHHQWDWEVSLEVDLVAAPYEVKGSLEAIAFDEVDLDRLGDHFGREWEVDLSQEVGLFLVEAADAVEDAGIDSASGSDLNSSNSPIAAKHSAE
jgi:hypothetical protein